MESSQQVSFYLAFYHESVDFREQRLTNLPDRSSGKLSLVTGQDGSSRNSHNSFQKRFGGESSSNVKPNPFNSITTTGVLSSPTSGASSAFGLGSGAFASFGSAKTPKTPGGHFFDNPLGGSTTKTLTSEKPAASTTATTTAGVAKVMGKRPSSASLQSDFKDSKARVSTPSACGPTGHPLRNGWVFWFRPPISKANGYIDYEKTVHRIASCETVEEFYSVYKHLKRPSSLPLVSDYHLFKKGVRPIWEDEENKKGGKWVVRLKKGVADRYWEDILLAIIGDQFSEASDEVCGVVLSVRNGEDILSIWARADGGRVLRIRLVLPPLTCIGVRPLMKTAAKP